MAHHSGHIKILNHAKSFDVCNKHQYEIYKVSLFSPVANIIVSKMGTPTHFLNSPDLGLNGSIVIKEEEFRDFERILALNCFVVAWQNN